jgi:hypothetical protein
MSMPSVRTIANDLVQEIVRQMKLRQLQERGASL